jgi:hypothetical protein
MRAMIANLLSKSYISLNTKNEKYFMNLTEESEIQEGGRHVLPMVIIAFSSVEFWNTALLWNSDGSSVE